MAYVGGKRDKAQLLYEKDVYTPEGAKTLTDKQLRKEYSRLRSISRKRLERFEGTEWTDTQIYQLNVGKYKPLKMMTSDRELRHLFSEVARFVMAETGSVSGLEKQRQRTVESLNERGYDFVTKDNFREFANFMEYARVSNLNRMYDSKRIADFYEASEKKKLSNDEMRSSFRSWARNQKKQKKIQNQNPRTSSQYRSEIDTLPEQSKTEMDVKQALQKSDWKPDYEGNAKRVSEQAAKKTKKDYIKEADKSGYAGWNHPKKKKGD